MIEAIANRDPALLIGEREDVAHLLEQPGFQRAGRATAVDEAGEPIGVVSITDIQRTVRATRVDNPADGSRRLASHV